MKSLLVSARAAFARARAFPLARPLSRIAVGAIVLTVLVVVGRATFARARPATIQADETIAAGVASSAPPSAEPLPVTPPAPGATPEALVAATPPAASPPAAEPDPPAPPPVAHGPATPEDPVILNDATLDDLQRLPGVGQKRALAILELRTRLGRFHQIEDLLKVRGIGLKTLRRLRPLVRLDRPAPADAGSG